MAAPVVSGIAALLWGQMPAASARADVEARLFATAQPITGTGVEFRYGLVDACVAVTGNAVSCGGQPPSPAPSPGAPAPPPPQTAQPAPIVSAPRATPRRNAVPGAYAGSLARRRGRLRVTVADGGNAIVNIQGTVQIRCASRTSTARIRLLSTTQYARIRSGGAFTLRTGRLTSGLRRPRLALAGQFMKARKRWSGMLRLTGQARSGGRCDSLMLRWSARLT